MAGRGIVLQTRAPEAAHSLRVRVTDRGKGIRGTDPISDIDQGNRISLEASDQ